MNDTVVNEIIQAMSTLLDCRQLKRLKAVLNAKLNPREEAEAPDSMELLELFLQAKEVEGRSPNTIAYYRATIERAIGAMTNPLCRVTANDLRKYLNSYQSDSGISNVTVDNIRRILSSFFGWLEDEDYIVKSPVRRIKRVRAPEVVKDIIDDEHMEQLRDGCVNERDLAIVDLLASTGMRVGELVKLNRNDVNLLERECLVMGKGNKQRKTYFDARAKLHLEMYLATRTDQSPALFVSRRFPHNRLKIGGVELCLRKLGKQLGIPRVHPHKFRRTLATNAIDKGMPIEQVQKLLGHTRIDTTMHYALVSQTNVKLSHRKYLG